MTDSELRRAELTLRDTLATAERHGWKYCGLDSHGYFARRFVYFHNDGRGGRQVKLYFPRAVPCRPVVA